MRDQAYLRRSRLLYLYRIDIDADDAHIVLPPPGQGGGEKAGTDDQRRIDTVPDLLPPQHAERQSITVRQRTETGAAHHHRRFQHLGEVPQLRFSAEHAASDEDRGTLGRGKNAGGCFDLRRVGLTLCIAFGIEKRIPLALLATLAGCCLPASMLRKASARTFGALAGSSARPTQGTTPLTARCWSMISCGMPSPLPI